MLSKPPKLGISDSVAKVVSAAMHKEAGLTFGVAPQPGTAPFENDEPPAWVSKLAKAAAKGLPAPKTFPKPDWTLGRLAVLPLMSVGGKKNLACTRAERIADTLKDAGIDAIIVEDGPLGRRLKEQDEAGTRACLLVGGEGPDLTPENMIVTVREYGKKKQYRARIKSVIKKFKAHP